MIPAIVWGQQDVTSQLFSSQLRHLPQPLNAGLQLPLHQNIMYMPQALAAHMSPNAYANQLQPTPLQMDGKQLVVASSKPLVVPQPKLAYNGLSNAAVSQLLANSNGSLFNNNNNPLYANNNNPLYANNNVVYGGVGQGTQLIGGGQQVVVAEGKKKSEEYNHGVAKKRPYDNKISNTTASQASLNSVEAKKAKIGSQDDSTKFVSIIGIPADVTDQDIRQITQSFGSILNKTVYRNHAVLEMENGSVASNLVAFYGDKVTFLRGQTVQLVLGRVEQPIGAETYPIIPVKENNEIDLFETCDEVSPILNVTIRDVVYPTGPELIAKIFNQYGETRQIVLLKNTKNLVIYLVEFNQIAHSELAQKKLDGQHIYAGCNKLAIKFSKIKDLKQNSEPNSSHINNALLSNNNNNNSNNGFKIATAINNSVTSTISDAQVLQFQELQQLQQLQQLQNFQNAQLQQIQQLQQLQQLPAHNVAMIQPATQQLLAQQLAQQHQHQLLQQNNQLLAATIMGNSLPAKIEYPGGLVALNQASMPTLQFAQFLQPQNQGLQMAGGQILAGGRNGGTILITPQLPNAAGNVLLISNLNEKKVSPDALFILFGVYGDVVRVKIMFNKQDTALIQFVDAMQAQTAMLNLDKLKLWGNVIKVAPSKHTIVQMPKDGQPDAGLTKDFTNSSLHRFKKPNSKNFQNIFPPSATLHLSNMPTISKEKLVELFAEHGTVVGFKFFFKDCKMALVQMSSIEEAAIALIHMHNYQLAETTHLRVSFSKSSVTSNSADGGGEQEIKE